MKGIYLRTFRKIEIKNDTGKSYFSGKGDTESTIEPSDAFILHGADGRMETALALTICSGLCTRFDNLCRNSNET